MTSPYGQLEIPVGDAWNVMFGLRLEYLRYDYDNNMVDGNTQDDGVTPCPTPAGCRYNRPADRTDDFLNLAPNIGACIRDQSIHGFVYNSEPGLSCAAGD